MLYCFSSSFNIDVSEAKSDSSEEESDSSDED